MQCRSLFSLYESSKHTLIFQLWLNSKVLQHRQGSITHKFIAWVYNLITVARVHIRSIPNKLILSHYLCINKFINEPIFNSYMDCTNFTLHRLFLPISVPVGNCTCNSAELALLSLLYQHHPPTHHHHHPE